MPQAAARGSDIGDDLARERTADREEGWPDAGDAPAAAALAPRRGGAPALAAGLLAGRPRRVGAAAARRRTGGMRGRRTGKGGRSRLCVGRPAVIQAHILALRGSEVHGHRRRRDALGWFCAAVSLVAACTGSRRRPRQHPGGDFPADGAGGLGHGRGLGSHLRLKLMAQLGQQLFGPLHRGHDLDAVSIVDELPKLQRSRAENHGRLRVPHQGDAQRRADGIQDLLLLLGVGARLGDAAEGLRRCGADLLGAWCGGWRLLPLLVLCNLGRRLLLGSLPGLLCFSRLLGDEQPSTRLRTRLL
mmetsp:Transcript_17054/g.47291  ORF Transcript_17054/g.47291 Transcript_17054/m.47291 type:complete len:302 (+) Transcript_17054:203-1108(+)